MSEYFWFNDEEWTKIEPHLPTNQQGPARHDDRRILSGIMQVMKSGCRWKDCPENTAPIKRFTIGLQDGANVAYGRKSLKP